MRRVVDSHRSFEFDRYPFDDDGEREHLIDPMDDHEAYSAKDIVHGMETSGAQPPRAPDPEP